MSLPVPEDPKTPVVNVERLRQSLDRTPETREVWIKIDNTEDAETYLTRLNRVYVDKGRLILEGEML